MTILYATWIVAALVCALLGAMLASSKGNAGIGFMLGLLFGPIGIVIALLLPVDPATQDANSIADKSDVGAHRVRCPFCAELIKPQAIKCRYCGSELTPSVQIEEFVPEGQHSGVSGADEAALRIEELARKINERSATFEVYEELIHHMGGKLETKGALMIRYVVSHNDTQTVLSSLDDLHDWTKENIHPK